MPTPPPPASAATVNAALDRLASSRSRWAGELDAVRARREARPTGFMSLLSTWRAQPVVALATGLWAAWSRHRAQANHALPGRTASVPVVVKGLVLSRVGPLVFGVLRRHPVLALTGLALVLVWGGWRRYISPRPSGPH